MGSDNKTSCTFFTGRLEASYTATVLKTQIARDSANLVVTHPDTSPKETVGRGKTVFGVRLPYTSGNNGCAAKGAATSNAAQDALMDGLVTDLAQRAAPVKDTLDLPLPGGKLGDKLTPKAEQQRWAALVEEAEKYPKLEKPNDDSFRFYMVGLGTRLWLTACRSKGRKL